MRHASARRAAAKELTAVVSRRRRIAPGARPAAAAISPDRRSSAQHRGSSLVQQRLVGQVTYTELSPYSSRRTISLDLDARLCNAVRTRRVPAGCARVRTGALIVPSRRAATQQRGSAPAGACTCPSDPRRYRQAVQQRGIEKQSSQGCLVLAGLESWLLLVCWPNRCATCEWTDLTAIRPPAPNTCPPATGALDIAPRRELPVVP